MSWFRSTPESETVLAEERLLLSATEAVEEAMASAGKNKQQLAELLNVRPTEISQRLSGRRNLTLRTLARMLHVLGMRVELTLKSALPAVQEQTLSNVISVSFELKEAEYDDRFVGRRQEEDKNLVTQFPPLPDLVARP